MKNYTITSIPNMDHEKFKEMYRIQQNIVDRDLKHALWFVIGIVIICNVAIAVAWFWQ